MKMISMSPIWFRLRRCAANLLADCRGVAALEFAMILPIMLVMFFGTVEFSSGVAVDRKVTLMARTLSDLTSQSVTVDDPTLTNFFAASTAIMTPYSKAPTRSTITELYVDPATLAARVQWSQGAAPHTRGTPMTIPAELKVAGTYLIWSEVTYQYVPTIGYVMGTTGVNLGDMSYTRPRQSACVIYPTGSSSTCPTF
jgi:Flp pilus assembly protein TadG